MKNNFSLNTAILLFFSLLVFSAPAQTNSYTISFENAVHHEASVKITFPEIKTKTITARMSRTSPGRYALHEFAKNVYDVKAKNSKGDALTITRPDPYSWEISDHDGTVILEYTLFGNRADGTYSQIDETHAHLNIPATFMFVEGMEHRPVEIDFDVREDLNWKVATQLKFLKNTTYYAPDLQYFMDSPTEISNYDLRQFKVGDQNIRFALHHNGTAADLDTYFEQVKAIVQQQEAVFGELPRFDYKEYTFLACYLPHVSGDGMEHRNSTILTDQEGLAQGGMSGNIATVSHEFFHSWNVERIRPDDLEPFDFTEANMSGALWFAEGFTSYYTGLILCRAGIISEDNYINGLTGTFNYVWNSPGRRYYSPVEMSYQAPFVDAATSVDPVNRENTFISYYSYGSVLGLALDLSLREKGLNLDDYMKHVWKIQGKEEVAYNLKDLKELLSEYAGRVFAEAFFTNYIHDSKMPDYKNLLASVGVSLKQDSKMTYLGARLTEVTDGILISGNSLKGSPLYEAGLDSGDIITAIDGSLVLIIGQIDTLLKEKSPGTVINCTYLRFGVEKTAKVKLQQDPAYTINVMEGASRAALESRKTWLGKK